MLLLVLVGQNLHYWIAMIQTNANIDESSEIGGNRALKHMQNRLLAFRVVWKYWQGM